MLVGAIYKTETIKLKVRTCIRFGTADCTSPIQKLGTDMKARRSATLRAPGRFHTPTCECYQQQGGVEKNCTNSHKIFFFCGCVGAIFFQRPLQQRANKNANKLKCNAQRRISSKVLTQVGPPILKRGRGVRRDLFTSAKFSSTCIPPPHPYIRARALVYFQ